MEMMMMMENIDKCFVDSDMLLLISRSYLLHRGDADATPANSHSIRPF